MARIRTIKPSFFTSQDVCACTPIARLLFIGLWGEADRAGRLHDKPGQLKFRLLPGDDVDVDALLWDLQDAGLISRRECDGGLRLIQIVKFEDHQKPHPKEPESTLTTESRERTRPAVEKHGGVGIHPVENPSTTARKGREQIQEQEWKGEGTTAPAHAAPAVPRGRPGSPLRWGLDHAQCVAGFCDWMCLPAEDFGRFAGRLGVDGEAKALAWAQSVRASGVVPTGKPWAFWNAQFDAAHGAPAPSSGGFSAADWAAHAPGGAIDKKLGLS